MPGINVYLFSPQTVSAQETVAMNSAGTVLAPGKIPVKISAIDINDVFHDAYSHAHSKALYETAKQLDV